MAWWRDAGVDLDFTDAPINWLPEPLGDAPPPPAFAPPPVAAEAVAAPAIGGEAENWPATLDEFAPWWLTELALDAGLVRGRVPPRGPAGATIMALVAHPEAGDSDLLLSGPQGRLFDAILAAMGIDQDAVYVASALPRHMPLADWPGLRAQGIGGVLAHHIALVRPQCLIVFGGNTLSLLGNDPSQPARDRPCFNHGDMTFPLLATRELSAMISRPTWKAAFWRTWLEFRRTALYGAIAGPAGEPMEKNQA